MTKQEIIDEMSSELNITKKQCNETMRTLIEETVSAVDRDDKFIQPGFGSFVAVVRDKHIGKNPFDGHKYLLEDFNSQSKKKYSLSASIGGGVFELNKNSIDKILVQIDKRMYEDKELYYKTTSHDRRRSNRQQFLELL